MSEQQQNMREDGPVTVAYDGYEPSYIEPDERFVIIGQEMAIADLVKCGRGISMSNLDLNSVSQSGLVCLAAIMTAAADRRLRAGNRWTMRLYEEVEIRKREIDIHFLHRLETAANRELKYYGCRLVHLADVIRTD